jgi:2-oxoglutarate ferredoxin oxidoreductase subunit beta
VERPFNPGELVIGAHGTFFARSIDAEVNLTTECMVAASKHDGLSVIEVLVNCMIFNNGTHKAFAGDKEVRAEHTITLRQGEKMLFGKNMDKGLMLDNMKLKVVTVGENGVTLDDILVHDAHEKDTMVHVMLASMKYPDFPVALGIIRDVAEPTYEREVARQIAEVQATAKIKNVDDLLNSGETWEVE